MYSGNLIGNLLQTVERVTKCQIPAGMDDFDKLCAAKVAIAHKIHKEPKSQELKDLWHKADRLQEEMWKHE